MVKMILDRYSEKTIHPVAGVVGGFSKPILEQERKDILETMRKVLDFALFTIDFAKKDVFPKYLDAIQTLGVIQTGYIGTVDDEGALNLYDGKIRIMKPDGTFTDFDVQAVFLGCAAAGNRSAGTSEGMAQPTLHTIASGPFSCAVRARSLWWGQEL